MHLYNLFVTYDKSAWDGAPFTLDPGRCVNSHEFTDPVFAAEFGDLVDEDIQRLIELPCIFAYENDHKWKPCSKNPHFGFLKQVARVEKGLKFTYKLQAINGFLTAQGLLDLSDELQIDVERCELLRTHWAVKAVDLPGVLRTHGIVVPSSPKRPVDVTKHHFDVGLSFPGEDRSLVSKVAAALTRMLGNRAVFYDASYTAQLARPNLDVLLQDIYRNRSRLVVTFLSGSYQSKKWCGVEFHAIRDIILEREDRVMYVRCDDSKIDGVFSTDGYIDARKHSPIQIAEFIRERIELLDHSTETDETS